MRECKVGLLICCTLNSLTAEAYTDLIERYILPLGAQRIHTDRGRNFHSAHARKFGEAHGIIMTYGLSYYHQIQGLVERTILDLRRSLETALPNGKPCAEFKRVVQEFVHLHNTSPHSRTGVSPFQYTYQWHHPDSIKDVLKSVINLPEVPNYRSIHDKGMAEAYLKQAAAYEAKARPSRIEPGLIVYRKFRQDNARVVQTGPHTVISALGSNSWVISPAPDAKRNVNLEVPANHLSPVLEAADLWAGIAESIRTIPNQF
jgi:hypothetical protein